MAQKIINIGSGELAGDGESLRAALIKVNENFSELYVEAANHFSGDYNDLINKPATDLTQLGTDIIPDSDATRDIGSEANRFDDVYARKLRADGFVFFDEGVGGFGQQLSLLKSSDNTTATLKADIVGYATQTYVDNAVQALDDDLRVGAPGALDSINELAQAINNDPNFFTTISNALDGKANSADVPNLGSVDASIIPDTDVAYDLGSATNRFRDLYLSGSTIDLGGTTLSIVGGELQLGGVKIPTTTDLENGNITINTSIDLVGSVFADDSTLLVDGVAGKIVGPVETTSVMGPEDGNLALGVMINGNINANIFINESLGITLQDNISFGSGSYNFDFNGSSITNAVFADNLDVNGNADIQGTLDVTGVTTLANNLNVGGNSSVTGNSSVVGNLNVTGDTTLSGNSSVAGNSYVAGDADVTGNLDVTGNITGLGSTISGFATIQTTNGNLTINAENYVYIDSTDNGQIDIGRSSGIGNVIIGNTANGTDVHIEGRLRVNGGGVPATSVGADGDVEGLVAFDENYIYYCIADYGDVPHIWKRVAWSGDTW